MNGTLSVCYISILLFFFWLSNKLFSFPHHCYHHPMRLVGLRDKCPLIPGLTMDQNLLSPCDCSGKKMSASRALSFTSSHFFQPQDLYQLYPTPLGLSPQSSKIFPFKKADFIQIYYILSLSLSFISTHTKNELSFLYFIYTFDHNIMGHYALLYSKSLCSINHGCRHSYAPMILTSIASYDFGKIPLRFFS